MTNEHGDASSRNQSSKVGNAIARAESSQAQRSEPPSPCSMVESQPTWEFFATAIWESKGAYPRKFYDGRKAPPWRPGYELYEREGRACLAALTNTRRGGESARELRSDADAATPSEPSAGIYKALPAEPTREMWAAMGNALVALPRHEMHHDAIAGAVYRAAFSAASTATGEA
jgi:hypothetical protein